MAWRLVLSPLDGNFGKPEALATSLSVAVPGIKWERFAIPPNNGAYDVWLGTVEHKGLAAMFRFVTVPPLSKVDLEVKGDGDPLPLLRSICILNSWSARSVESGLSIDLLLEHSSEWEHFLGSMRIMHGTEYGKVQPNADDIRRLMQDILCGAEPRQEFTIVDAAEREGRSSLHIAIATMTDSIGWCVTAFEKNGAMVLCRDIRKASEFVDCIYSGSPTRIRDECILTLGLAVEATSYFLKSGKRFPRGRWTSLSDAITNY